VTFTEDDSFYDLLVFFAASYSVRRRVPEFCRRNFLLSPSAEANSFNPMTTNDTQKYQTFSQIFDSVNIL
jgi:hypothetical protein